MSNMIDEAGGVNTRKAKEIKSKQLYGIEFDREIYAPVSYTHLDVYKRQSSSLGKSRLKPRL